MASCDQISLLLGPFEDGELEPHEMEEVAFHIVGCAACKAALEEYRALGIGLRDLAVAPPLEGFTCSVVARLTPKRASRRERWSGFPRWLERIGAAVQVAGIAAATAIATIFVIPYAQQHLHRARQTPVVAASAGDAAGSPAAAHPSPALAQAALPVIAQPQTAGALDLAASQPEDLIAARDSQELVSELGGGDNPAVAVWSEPRTDTTVVWIPDHP